MNSISNLNGRVNKFINVLVQILNINDYSHIISWSNDGKLIDINNVEEFRNIIIFKYFKYTNLSNFIRQLNLYSFKKVVLKKSKIISYYHPLFSKDSSHEYLLRMTRNKISIKTKIPLSSKFSSLEALEAKVKEIESQIEKMAETQKLLLSIKKTNILQSKDSFQYSKDLELFIYHALKLPIKDNNIKINKGFENRLTKKINELVNREDPFQATSLADTISSNDELDHFLRPDFDSNINNEYVNFTFDETEEDSLDNIKTKGLFNLSTKSNLNNPFLSFNYKRNINTRLTDKNDSYFSVEY